MQNSIETHGNLCTRAWAACAVATIEVSRPRHDRLLFLAQFFLEKSNLLFKNSLR